jgi:hypothetical protein
MTLGLEEFLKELRAEEGITVIEFRFFEAKDTKLQMLDLDICIGDRNADHEWLEYDLSLDPLPFQKKLPKSFASTLKQIKKEIKNQSKS